MLLRFTCCALNGPPLGIQDQSQSQVKKFWIIVSQVLRGRPALWCPLQIHVRLRENQQSGGRLAAYCPYCASFQCISKRTNVSPNILQQIVQRVHSRHVRLHAKVVTSLWQLVGERFEAVCHTANIATRDTSGSWASETLIHFASLVVIIEAEEAAVVNQRVVGAVAAARRSSRTIVLSSACERKREVATCRALRNGPSCHTQYQSMYFYLQAKK